MTTPDLAEQKKRYQIIYDDAFEVGRTFINQNFPQNEALQELAAQRITVVFFEALKKPQGAESFKDPNTVQEYINTGIGSAAISLYGLKKDTNPLAISLALHTIREKADAANFTVNKDISEILLDKAKMALLLGGINSGALTRKTAHQGRVTAQDRLMITLRKDIDFALAKAGFDPLPSMQSDHIER